MLILRDYIDFLANKLKESRANPLDALIAFIVAWACTDSTNPFSITLRRMLGLPYVGKIEEAFSMILARVSSDTAFRSKAIEALVLAIERDWVRKDLLEAAWKNAAKELLQAMKDLYEIRKAYAIKMFMQEIERAIIAQEEKTFETVPPPMSTTEEIVLPPQPKEEEIKSLETAKEAPEETALDALLDMFESIKASLDTVGERIQLLVEEVRALKDHLQLIGESLLGLPDAIKESIHRLSESMKTLQITPPTIEHISPAPAKPKAPAQVPAPSPPEPKAEERVQTRALMEELEKTLSEEELPVQLETIQQYFVCLGNMSRLGEMLAERVVPTHKLRWSIRISKENVVYEIILQGLYRDIPEEDFHEIMSKGIGVLIILPVKNTDALQSIVNQLSTLMRNLRFVVLDSESPLISFEKLKGTRIILQKIRNVDDLERIFRDKIVPALSSS